LQAALKNEASVPAALGYRRQYKVVETVALAFWTQDMLVKQGIIRQNIINSA